MLSVQPRKKKLSEWGYKTFVQQLAKPDDIVRNIFMRTQTFRTEQQLKLKVSCAAIAIITLSSPELSVFVPKNAKWHSYGFKGLYIYIKS